MIYLECLSRKHFIRKFVKSRKIIEQTLYSNKNKEIDYQKFNSFQFFKYHSFIGNTKGNTFPLFFRNKRSSLKGISIINFLNDRGFITAAAHNSCNKELYDWGILYKDIIFPHFDHENIVMFCDTNYEDNNNKWSIFKGKNTILRRCFYGRDSFEYIFEYILQFLEAYKNERKFFRIVFEDGHESTKEVAIKYKYIY